MTVAEQECITREQLGPEALAEYERAKAQVAEVGLAAFIRGQQSDDWFADCHYETYDDEEDLIRVEYDGEGVGYSLALAEAAEVLEKALEILRERLEGCCAGCIECPCVEDDVCPGNQPPHAVLAEAQAALAKGADNTEAAGAAGKEQ